MRLLRQISILAAFFVMLLTTGCIMQNEGCPVGWMLTADGSCVRVDLQGDGDIDRDAIVIVPDRDTNPEDGDVDKDTPEIQEPPDGDENNTDGDDEPYYQPCETKADCAVNQFCHNEVESGLCNDPCTESSFCDDWVDGYFCNSEGLCAPEPTGNGCTDSLQCEYGKVCHLEVGDDGACAAVCTSSDMCELAFGEEYSCNALQRCVPDENIQTNCTVDDTCPVEQLCHYEYNGGVCGPPCDELEDCSEFEGFFCNSEQRCIPVRATDDCEIDFECPYLEICHTEVAEGNGRCGAYCIDDTVCDEFEGEGQNLYFCNYYSRCYPYNGSGCTSDEQCPYESVCHDQAGTEGICYTPCASHEDCDPISEATGQNLGCNGVFKCVPWTFPDGDDDGEIIDGDSEPDVDVDPDPDPDPDPDADSACLNFTDGYNLELDFETVQLTCRAKTDGETYVDPTSLSRIYVRDALSGSQPVIYNNFSNGGTLPAVEMIKGRYHFLAMNGLGQRETVLENIDLQSDTTLDVPFPMVSFTVTLTKNGLPFPTLDQQYRGNLIVKIRNISKEVKKNTVGNGVNTFSFQMFPALVDIIFEGFLTNDSDSYQRETLISSKSIVGGEEIEIDIETVTVGGAIKINGMPPASGSEERGEVWFINSLKKDRFPFWSLGTTALVNFSREIIVGNYQIAFAGPGIDGKSYLWKSTEILGLDEDDDTIIIDLPRYELSGEITAGGDSLPDHLFLDRGTVYLKEKGGSEKFVLSDLGFEGIATFDTEVGPGTYELYYEGSLLDDEWFTVYSYPTTIHTLTFDNDFTVSADMADHDIDLPVVDVTGTVKLNGQPYETLTDGQYLTVKYTDNYTYIAIQHLGSLAESRAVYSTPMFAAEYDSMRYMGSALLGTYSEFYVKDGFTVSQSSKVVDVNIVTKTVGVTVTVDDGEKTLQSMLDDESLTQVGIYVIDKDVYNRTTGDTEMSSNRFEFVRPPGLYTLLLRLVNHNNYMEYPLISDFELTKNEEFDFDIDLRHISYEVLKDGLQMPDTANGQSRGNIQIRSKADANQIVYMPFENTGPAVGDMWVIADSGEYSLVFSSGYGQAFQFIMWKYLDCATFDR